MVSVCPKESDPRPLAESFVASREDNIIGGLISEGLYALMDVLQDEIQRQNPGSRVLVFSKEHMIDHHVMTARDLRAYLSTIDWSDVCAVVMRDDICVIGWQTSFPAECSGIPLYVGGYGCRGVPMCVKNVNAFGKK